MSASFQLDHLNVPARDPEGLARWYAQTFGLQADGHHLDCTRPERPEDNP